MPSRPHYSGYLSHRFREWHPPEADYANPESLYYNPASSAPVSVELIGSWKALYQKQVCPPNSKALEGNVLVQLTIDKDGVPKAIQVVESLEASYDKEAIRVLKQARFTNPSGEDHEIRTKVPFSCEK